MRPLNLRALTPANEQVRAGLMIPPVLLILEALVDFPRAILSLHVLALLAFSLTLSGTILTSIQVLTRANWMKQLGSPTRQVMRLNPATGLFLFFTLVFSTGYYLDIPPLSQPQFREFWLSRTFILIRSALFIFLWVQFNSALLRSVRTDAHHLNGSYSERSVRLSVGFLLVFGSTWWLACVDWLMALSPGWHSSIFWLYCFAGTLLGGVALVAVIYILRESPTSAPENPETIHHDLGKMIFGLSCFWAYLWFSQFMLIWYANLPGESVYFYIRTHSEWEAFFYINLVLNWLLPAVLLLPRQTKRHASSLLYAACVVLAGRWLDILLMVFPGHLEISPWYGLFTLAPLFPLTLLAIRHLRNRDTCETSAGPAST